MTTLPYHLIENLTTYVTIPEDGIVSRTVYQDEHVKAVLFGFSPQQELSEHTASTPAIMHFLQGHARITIGTESSDAQPGTWVYMTPNLPHSVVAQDPLVMVLLLLKTPKPAEK